MTRTRCATWLCVLAAACGTAGGAMPSTPRPMPEPSARGQAALSEFGERLYRALARGRPDEIAFSSSALPALLLPSAEQRLLAMRAGTPGPTRLPDEQRALWAEARFAELCVQQGRSEPAGGALGLRADGFVFERALVVGREAGGGVLAGWIEGQFLHTDAGFGALRLDRIEAPRRDHADLELAVCELRVKADDHKH